MYVCIHILFAQIRLCICSYGKRELRIAKDIYSCLLRLRKNVLPIL